MCPERYFIVVVDTPTPRLVVLARAWPNSPLFEGQSEPRAPRDDSVFAWVQYYLEIYLARRFFCVSSKSSVTPMGI